MNTKFSLLEKHASVAIAQYNKEVAGGGEPVFPEWANDQLELLASHDKLAGLVVQFGDRISDLFEQLVMGGWVDSHGNSVELNQAMIALKAPMMNACSLSASASASFTLDLSSLRTMLRKEAERAAKTGAARDMAVAEAVRGFYLRQNPELNFVTDQPDLASIIARVPS